MNTRRQMLVSRDAARQGNAPTRVKTLTIRDLSETKVILPQELQNSNMTLIVTVNPDGRLVPGLIKADKVPQTKPISDLTRLQRARRLVSSVEATSTKTSAVEEVRNQVLNKLEETRIDPDQVHFRSGAQSEIFKCKAHVQALLRNIELFSDFSENRSAHYGQMAAKWFESSLLAIDKYVSEVLTSESHLKLNDCISTAKVPRFFFTKMSNICQELGSQSIDEVLFPKKLSKMFTLLKKEIDFLTDDRLFQSTKMYLRACITQDTPDDTVLYPLPPSFSRLFGSFTDLPVIDRSKNDATILSVTLLHVLFAAFPAKALTVDNIIEHESRFLRRLPGKDESLEDCLNVPMFKYDLDSNKPLKVQYKEFFVMSYVSVKCFHFSEELSNIFHITASERKRFNIPYLFYTVDPNPIKLVIKTMFLPELGRPKEAVNSLIKEKIFSSIKVVAPREQSYGAPMSDLTPTAKTFLLALKKGGGDLIFIKNLQAYLQSFNDESFQDIAIKTIKATISAKEILVEDLNEVEDKLESDIEDVEPIIM